MIYDKLFVPLGVDSTPIGQRKCIAPAVGAALVAGGSSLLGSLLGIGSQSSANAQNLQLMRETNQMNYKIADEQNRNAYNQFAQNLAWLKEQYYDTGQYERLVKSLGRAGLNPALAFGNVSPVGSVGQASPTAFHVAQMEAGHVDPLSFDGLSESVGNAVNAYFQNKLVDAQVENVSQDTQTKRLNNASLADRNLLELRNLYEDVQDKLAQRDLSKSQRKYYKALEKQISRQVDLFNDTYNELKSRESKSNRLIDAQAENQLSQSVLNMVESRLKPALANMQIRLSNAQIGVFNEQARNIAQQTITEFERGQLTNRQAFEQTLRNRLLGAEWSDKVFKTGVRDGSALSKAVYWFSDYVSDIIFGGFGKLLK